jgi:tripartite-type tricarboxylate transporter receptor subunit TctC
LLGQSDAVLPEWSSNPPVLSIRRNRRSEHAEFVSFWGAGFADAEYPIWFGIFAPAKTPRDIIEKLHRETIKALQAPKVADKLSGLGVDPMVMPPAEFGKR